MHDQRLAGAQAGCDVIGQFEKAIDGGSLHVGDRPSHGLTALDGFVEPRAVGRVAVGQFVSLDQAHDGRPTTDLGEGGDVISADCIPAAQPQ